MTFSNMLQETLMIIINSCTFEYKTFIPFFLFQHVQFRYWIKLFGFLFLKKSQVLRNLRAR